MVAVGVMSSGLLVAGWLYAEDTDAGATPSTCTAYTGDSESDSCCTKNSQLLCQIDTDLNSSFNKLWSTLSKYFAPTDAYVNGYQQELNADAGASKAYIGNDNMRDDTITSTKDAVTASMLKDPNSQTQTTKAFAALMPAIADQNFEVNNFSMSTLMNNPAINSDTQKNQIEQLIQVLANAGNPVKNLENNVAIQNYPRVQEFLASLGTYNAATSNALNVLHGIKAERTVTSGTGSLVGISSDLSPMQLEMNNVQKALSYGDSSAFDDASMQDIAKTSYYVQAQMLYQLFKLHESLQQLNATMAVMQLQMLNSVNKSDLENLRNIATNT